MLQDRQPSLLACVDDQQHRTFSVWLACSLLEVFRQSVGQINVGLLRGLISTARKQNEFVPTERVVDAVSGADIDLQLGNAVLQFAVLPWVPKSEALDPSLDASTTRTIPQIIKPVGKTLGRFDLVGHGAIVSHGIQIVNTPACPWASASKPFNSRFYCGCSHVPRSLRPARRKHTYSQQHESAANASKSRLSRYCGNAQRAAIPTAASAAPLICRH